MWGGVSKEKSYLSFYYNGVIWCKMPKSLMIWHLRHFCFVFLRRKDLQGCRLDHKVHHIWPEIPHAPPSFHLSRMENHLMWAMWLHSRGRRHRGMAAVRLRDWAVASTGFRTIFLFFTRLIFKWIWDRVLHISQVGFELTTYPGSCWSPQVLGSDQRRPPCLTCVVSLTYVSTICKCFRGWLPERLIHI